MNNHEFNYSPAISSSSYNLTCYIDYKNQAKSTSKRNNIAFKRVSFKHKDAMFPKIYISSSITLNVKNYEISNFIP